MSKNVYQRFADRIAENADYVMRAAAVPPDFADFAWMAGDWTWEMHILETPSTPARVATGTFTFVVNGNAIWSKPPNRDAAPYYTYDPFNQQWVLSLANPTSYGSMTGKGWQDGKITFEGTMTFMGIEMRLRQTIHKVSNDETLTKNWEWLDGAWVPVDEIITRRRHGAS